ncbi:MAG: Asp-tRNA(Asn)/Glu-tRNA(Gln) amidotransferase subunit GatA [Deltaproteobacteria bacterium]|nr:Asp-tRNA(Asn)/Glu-tRNA(Gln) amidotransferase subunit GatA [Deltaproteobacteria bacterium]
MSAPHQASLMEIRNRLADGLVSAEAVARDCLDRIAAAEPRIRAFLTMRPEALDEAKALDAQGPDPSRPLWGVPVTLEDMLVTCGTRTTAASRMLENFVPAYDATVVEKLRAAGAVILGKTNLDEFGMGSGTENSAFQVTANPWNMRRIPGGSSGGSAASVSARQCFASLGMDTDGSIRQSAALCGCVGLKPTYGRVSRYGCIPCASSLDQIGPIARSVPDCALMLSVIAGCDSRDGAASRGPVDDYVAAALRTSLEGVKCGVPREFFAEDMDPEVSTICARTLALLRARGAELVEVSLPLCARHAVAASRVIAAAEASSNLARYDGVRYGYRTKAPRDLADLYIRSRTEAFGEEVQRRILIGTFVLSSDCYDAYYRKAAQVRRLIRENFQRALSACDVILAPVSPVPAWEIGSRADDPLAACRMDIFTAGLNLAGLPGLALPVGLTADRLPVGMQLMGAPFSEAALCGIGNAVSLAVGSIGEPDLVRHEL